MIIYFLVVEFIKLIRQKARYFSSFWNCVELMQIVSAVITVAFHIVKEQLILNRVKNIAKNPFAAISFSSALAADDLEIGAMSLAIFLATLKLLKMIRFNYHVVIFCKTIKKSAVLLLSFALIFFVVFLAFAEVGVIVFGTNIEEYSSMGSAIWYQLQLVLGTALPIYEMGNINSAISRIFAFSFLFSLNIFLMNVFIVIVNDSYVDASDIDQTTEEFKMADFMMQQLSQMLSTVKSPAKKQEDTCQSSTTNIKESEEKDLHKATSPNIVRKDCHLSSSNKYPCSYERNAESASEGRRRSSLELPEQQIASIPSLPSIRCLDVQDDIILYPNAWNVSIYQGDDERCSSFDPRWIKAPSNIRRRSTLSTTSLESGRVSSIGAISTYSSASERHVTVEEPLHKHIAGNNSNQNSSCPSPIEAYQEKMAVEDANQIELYKNEERLIELMTSQIEDTLTDDAQILNLISRYIYSGNVPCSRVVVSWKDLLI